MRNDVARIKRRLNMDDDDDAEMLAQAILKRRQQDGK